jgi:hypothetical protein
MYDCFVGVTYVRKNFTAEKVGHQTWTGEFTLYNPNLWWPRGHGT